MAAALAALVQEWARTLGMSGLQTNASGGIGLKIESVGSLRIDPHEEDAIVYLLREISLPSAAIFRRALQLCHPAERLPFAANCGLRGENLLGFFIRLESEDLTLPRLEAAIEQLRQMHDRLAV